MKNKWVLRGILLSSIVITGCGGGSNSSTPSVTPSLPSSSDSSFTSINFGGSSSKEDSSVSSNSSAASSTSKPTSSSKPSSTSSAKPSSSTKPSSSSNKPSSSQEQNKLLSITINSRKTVVTYEIGDEFIKPVVIAHYSKDDDKDVSSAATCTGFDSSTKGEKTIEVSYTEGGITVNASYVITVKDKTTSLNDIVKLYNVLSSNELNNSNSAVKEEITVSGTAQDKIVENITNYADYSSSSTGTYTRTNNEETEKSDTFKSIKTKVTDKYKIDGNVVPFDMYVVIKDFDNDTSTSYNYTDKVSKQFIINSQTEADSAGLSGTQYILKSDFAGEASANLTRVFFNFLLNYAANNIYLETLELTSVVVTTLENGNVQYSFDETYGFDNDEGNRLDTAVSFDLTLNSTSNRILSYNYSYLETETNKLDPNDNYTTGVKGSGTISYGDKTSDKTGALNYKDYFLEDINEVELLGRNANFDDVPVNPDYISRNYSYLFARATSYTPAKAVDTDLSPESTSNSAVVQLDRGMFKIVGNGTCIIKFSYYKLVEGVYELSYKTFNVNITDAVIQSLSIGTYRANPYQSEGLIVGQTYDWPINASPYNADPTITAVSSDPSVLRVEIVKAREVRIIPVGTGLATVTITSTNNPAVTAEKKFNVLDPTVDWADYLLKNHFFYDGPYGYTYDLYFNANGTGRRVEETSTGQFEDTFNYTFSDGVIRFMRWSYTDYRHNDFDTGIFFQEILKDGTLGRIGLNLENDEKAQQYYVVA